MNAIDPARLAAALRRSTGPVGALGKPSPAGATRRSGTAAARGPARSERGGSAETVAALVARRVQSIDRDDPQRHAKAFRAFLESVLIAEFGDALVNDAGFHRLVDDVQAEMQSDRELAAQVRDAAACLLGERAAPAVG